MRYHHVMNAQELDKRFSVPDVLAFESGPGGLVKAVVTTSACSGEMYLYGAHVTGFQPTGHRPVLFMSGSSAFQQGKAIRGGVPVCFPWFGPHATDKSAPSHGPARITLWELTGVEHQGDTVTLMLSATFEPYAVDYRVTFGQALEMVMAVRNTSDSQATFEAALHTYLSVGDVRQVQIAGLSGVAYLDKVDGQERKRQPDEPITFTQETDRVYVDTDSACVLTDPVIGRRITIDKTGSQSTVVWNPWVDKSAAMGDFGNEEWPGMACIETANAGPNAVVLAPGATHEMSATISVGPL